MTRATLAALVARIEQGEVTDALERELTVFFHDNGGIGGVNYGPDLWIIRNGGEWLTSIDAQAALPGRILHANIRYGDGGESWEAMSEYKGASWVASAPTEAAARLAALLRAMMEGMSDE